MLKIKSYIKQNETILNTKIDCKVIMQFRLLDTIDYSNIESKIENYKKYVNTYTPRYKVEGTKKRKLINLVMTESLMSKFIEIDKLGIDIKKFIKYCLEFDIEKKVREDKQKQDEKVFDFKKNENQFITLNDVKGENNLSKCYQAFIKQVTFNTSNDSILEYKKSVLEKIKKISLKHPIVVYGIDYKPRHIQSRIDLHYTSNQVVFILDFYKKIIFFNSKDKLISDELRFKILKSYYEMMKYKTSIVNHEISKIPDYNWNDGFHKNFGEYDHDLDKGKIEHNDMISHIKDEYIYYDISLFSYISNDSDNKIKTQYVPLPHNVKNSTYQSGYIYAKPKSATNLTFYSDDKQIDIGEYEKLLNDKNNTKKLYTRIRDKKLLNIFGDTETNSLFFKILNDKHIQIDKPEFLKLLDENYKYLQNLNEDTKAKITRDNEECILHKSSINDLLIKHKIYMKTDLQTIQAYFHNSKTNEYEIKIWVHEKNKKVIDIIELEYKFEQKLKNQKITHTVKADIIYTDKLTNSFLTYTNNWYERNIDTNTNSCPMLTIWFHNLKFDMLAMGLLDTFEEYDYTLTGFNNDTPRSYSFELAPIEMKTKEAIPKILFLDSFNFSQSPLKEMGVNVGIKKETEKVDFSYNDNIFENKEKSLKLLEYSLMDVVILKEFICNLKSEILKFTDMKYGSAGTAISCFLTSFYDDTFWYQEKTSETKISKDEYNNLNESKKSNYKRKNNRIHKHRNKWLEAVELYAYIGGHTEVFNKIGLTELIRSLDINSSYPSSMLQKLPKKFLYSRLNISIEEFQKLQKSKDKYTLSKVYIEYDDNFIVPVKNNNQIEYPVINTMTTWLHEPELNCLLKYNKNIKILETLVYDASSDIFTSYVTEWMFTKSFNKRKDIDNKLVVALSKLFANSCYGKLGEKTRVSACRKMTESDIEMCRFFMQAKDEIKYTDEDIKNSQGYFDIEFGVFPNSPLNEIDTIEFINTNTTFVDLSNNVRTTNLTTLRINLSGGYISYSKKIITPGKNSSYAMVGAITAYSRVALLDYIKKLGFKNIRYCDTDSVYVQWKKVIEKRLNEIKPTKEDLKYMYTNKKTYKEILEKYEKQVNPDKINVCKSLVSKHYFWEFESEKPYHIITRGNKDNIKLFDLNKDQLFIINEDNTLEDFLKSDLKYCVKEENLIEMSSCLNKNIYMCKDSEKLKGIPKSAVEVDLDLYFYQNWLTPMTQKRVFGNLKGQYISYTLKTQDQSRLDYPKAKGILTNKTKEPKNINMVFFKPVMIDYEIIDNKFEFSKVINQKYYDYRLKPYEVKQINNDLYYYNPKTKKTSMKPNDI